MTSGGDGAVTGAGAAGVASTGGVVGGAAAYGRVGAAPRRAGAWFGEVLNGQQLWLCWDARRGTGGGRFSPSSTPAGLVSDDGWVMHGMFKVEDAKHLAAEATSATKAGAGTAAAKAVAGTPSAERSTAERGAARDLRLWDPRSAWPLFVRPVAMALSAVLLACAALLTCDLPGFLRWVTGIGGVVTGCAVACLLTVHESLRSLGKGES